MAQEIGSSKTPGWVQDLRGEGFEGWRNTAGSSPDRLYRMGHADVVDEYFSGEDVIVDVGCSNGSTSTNLSNTTEAEIMGVDLPQVLSRSELSENQYGEGSQPQYVGGLSPHLPLQDSSVDGVAALNSLTYLARQMEDPEEFSKSVLEDFARITNPGGYVLLGEQTESSYLVLQEDSESGRSWQISDFDAEVRDTDRELARDGERSLHIRYEPWVSSPEVEWSDHRSQETYKI